MISCLEIKDGKLETSSYFLGTMLFIGDYSENTDNSKTILVVDGQQRITTITILFSALSDRFKLLNEPKLSSKIFEYIMTEDDDGNEVRILESNALSLFFILYSRFRKKKRFKIHQLKKKNLLRNHLNIYLTISMKRDLKIVSKKD